MTPIIKNALINALGTALYVVLVVSILFNGDKIFPSSDGPKNIVVPMIMLLLFVFSAAVTGSLVFGRPLMWYLDGRKQEALSLLGYTIASLFGILVILFVAALLVP